MDRKPNPRFFPTMDAYQDAYVGWFLRNLPRVTDFDGFDVANAKRAALTEAAIEARCEAFDVYSAMLESVAEDFERGVGPAWAD